MLKRLIDDMICKILHGKVGIYIVALILKIWLDKTKLCSNEIH